MSIVKFWTQMQAFEREVIYKYILRYQASAYVCHYRPKDYENKICIVVNCVFSALFSYHFIDDICRVSYLIFDLIVLNKICILLMAEYWE